MTHTLRLATDRDLPEIVRIYNQTIAARTATADLEPITVASRSAWLAEHDPSSHPLWVVESPSGVLGWLSLQRFHARAAYRATAELSVYVDARVQRSGVGHTLVTHALAHAPELGLRTLLALVFGHNTPSLALFAAFGFQRWGELPRVAELDGVERDLILLGRRIA